MTWHTVREAAAILDLSEQTVYQLVESRRLAHRRVGLKPGRGKIQVSDANIAEYLKSCEVAAEAPQVKAKPGRPKTPTFSGRPDGKPITLDWCK